MLHLKNELNRGTFFMTLQNQPVALSLYRQVRAARPCARLAEGTPESPTPPPGSHMMWQMQLTVAASPHLHLLLPSFASTRSERH